MLPGLAQLRGYRLGKLPGDLAAGLIVAALAVPQALGYSTVAGVPVQVGLYTIPPALLAYALFGSSRVLYVGPVSTVSVLSGSIVRGVAGGDPEHAAALTSNIAIMAGIVLIIVGLLRMGWVAQFLSKPIVTGFVTGLVVLIVVGEIPGLLGLPTPQGALLERVIALGLALPSTKLTTLAVAVASLVILFGGSRLLPRVPWALVVLVAGIAASQLLDLAGQGAAIVGPVPTGVPMPVIPAFGVSEIPTLVTGGIAIAAVGMAEGLAAASTFAATSKTRHAGLDDNAEFIGNGAADIASGLFGGMGVAGSLSKTAANVRAGATTQVSGIAGAIIVVLVLLFATRLLAPLPKAVLSAIVIHAVWGLVKPSQFRRYRQIRRNDLVASVAALVGVLVAGPLNGLLIAVGQSLLGLVYRSMQVHIDEMGKVPGEKAAWGSVANDPARRTVKRICVLRPDGPLFWANATEVVARIERAVGARTGIRALILDMEATNQLDTTTSEQLSGLIHRLRDQGIEVYLVRVFGNVRGVLTRSGILELLGEDRVWHSISAGVKAAKADVAERRAAEVADPGEMWDPYDDVDLDDDPVLGDDDDEHIVTRQITQHDDEADRHLDDRPAGERVRSGADGPESRRSR